LGWQRKAAAVVVILNETLHGAAQVWMRHPYMYRRATASLTGAHTRLQEVLYSAKDPL
jgi:hypothetical protein